MSFQYSSLFIAGNTCHIEIESLPGTEGWHEFAAQLAARWMQIPGARPDWGKQWSFIPGVMEHMKEVGISRTIHITKIHHDNCCILLVDIRYQKCRLNKMSNLELKVRNYINNQMYSLTSSYFT